VLLYEPEPTPYDLRWRMFGVDVRVHPLFWLVSAVLGWNHYTHPILGGNGLLDLGLWVVCVFVSILLHELGHVFMGRRFGSDGHIVLYSMGGLAIGSSGVPLRWQRIAVFAAGPGIQLLLWAALWLLTSRPASPIRLEPLTPMWLLVIMLLTINLWWALLNLLPVWPLDGGQICREVCVAISPRRGVVISLWISLVVSAVIALNSLLAANDQPHIPYLTGGWFTVIMFALFAVSSYQALEEERKQERFWDDWS
jgi:Zn-dependent protease